MKKNFLRYIKPKIKKETTNINFFNPNDLLAGETCCCNLAAPLCYQCISPCLCSPDGCAL